jgi:hypothetical protein
VLDSQFPAQLLPQNRAARFERIGSPHQSHRLVVSDESVADAESVGMAPAGVGEEGVLGGANAAVAGAESNTDESVTPGLPSRGHGADTGRVEDPVADLHLTDRSWTGDSLNCRAAMEAGHQPVEYEKGALGVTV